MFISINAKLESIINIDKGESRKSVAKRLNVSVSTIAGSFKNKDAMYKASLEFNDKRKRAKLSSHEVLLNLIKNNLTDDNCLLHITHIINTFNNHVDKNVIQSKMNNYFNKK